MSTHTRRSRRRGAVTVEFAIVLPFLMLLLFGIIEFGWFMSMRQQIVMVTRDAARFGSLPGKTADEVHERLKGKLLALGIESFRIETDSENEDDSVAVVTVPYGEISLTGQFLPVLGDSKIVIRAQARNEMASLEDATG